VRDLDEFAARLRALLAWSGLTYRELHRRVAAARRHRGVAEVPSFNTVYRCLRPGRTRLDVEVVVDIVAAIVPADTQAWRQAHQQLTAHATEASIVRVTGTLSGDDAGFVGRAAELAGLLSAARATGPVVVAIDGMPGIGKTTLGTRAARLLDEPGRLVLSVDLRGHDPRLPPADPAAALDGFLRVLGVPGSQIHGLDIAARTSKFHELLKDRPAVLVLDNATTEEQVRPLLPGTPGSVVLVTSRRPLRLPGVAVHLDVLAPAESLELLRDKAGTSWVAADENSATAIADLLGHLPLGLAVLAARIVATPGWTPADHLDRLCERRAGLRIEDGVEIVLASSYAELSPAGQRLLRLLSEHPGPDFDAYVAAALTGTDLGTATSTLAELRTATLAQPHHADRFRLHDLVKVFATARARDEETARARRAALTGLFDYHGHVSAVAMDVCAPQEHDARPPAGAPPGPAPGFADADAATAWLDDERASLVAGAVLASELGRFGHPSRLSRTLARYLSLGSLEREAEIVHGCAARSPDAADRARALQSLGATYWRTGRFALAAHHLGRSLDECVARGDRAGQCRTLVNLSLVHGSLGEFDEALRLLRDARELSTEPWMAARVLNNLGYYSEKVGALENAVAYYAEATEVSLARGDHDMVGQVAGNLAALQLRLGRADLALCHATDELAIARRFGNSNGQAGALNLLGTIHAVRGERAEALRDHQAALDIVETIGRKHKEAEVRNDFGVTARRFGDRQQALRQHRTALAVATECGERYEQARAHAGIAETLAADGRRTEGHWQRAIELFDELGTPEAAELRLLAEKDAAGSG
jgi:tetratricopeptide (TPR) repeat protein